jgi:hypothetical protein
MYLTVDYTFMIYIILRENFEIVYAGAHFARFHSTCSDILHKTRGYYYKEVFSVTLFSNYKGFCFYVCENI